MERRTLLEPDNSMNGLIKYWNDNKNDKQAILLIYSYLITRVNIYICNNPVTLTLNEIEALCDQDLTRVSLQKLWLKLLYKYIDETDMYNSLLKILS